MDKTKLFDAWAGAYDADVRECDEKGLYPFAGYSHLSRLLYARIPDNCSVLDLGCGTGTLARSLVSRGCRVTGVDSSEKMITLARKKVPDAELYTADLSSPLPLEIMFMRYDRIVLSYSLHHLPESKAYELILCCLSLLKENGLLLIGDIAFADEGEKNACRTQAGSEWDESEFYQTYERAKNLFPSAVFEPVSFCAGLFTLTRKDLPVKSSPVIETERLYLREMTDGDLPALSRVFCDVENMKYYPYSFDTSRVLSWIAKNRDRCERDGMGLMCVCLRNTGEVIGDCGVTLQMIGDTLLPEIGYHIRRDMQGRGYAKEAARAAVDRFFQTTSFPALYSYCKYTNTPSRRTAEAIGMGFFEEYPDPNNILTHVSRITHAHWCISRASLSFRAASDADKADILSLYRTAMSSPFSTWNEEYPAMDNVEEDLASSCLFVLTDENGHISGAVSITPENELDGLNLWDLPNGAKEIARAVLAPRLRGQGLASALVSLAQDEALRLGGTAIHLLAAVCNRPAVRTYLSLGYRVQGKTHMYGHDYYAMEKSLL